MVHSTLRGRRILFVSVFLLMAFRIGIQPVFGQEDTLTAVADASISGQIEEGKAVVYRVSDLLADDTLYLYAANTDGNLDPMLYVLDDDADILAARQAALDAAEEADGSGEDALTAYLGAVEELTLAWDDDSGEGYDAALDLLIPQDGDYLIVVDSNVTLPSSGEFRLNAGVNTPEVLDGESPPASSLEIELNEHFPVQAIQSITGTLTVSQTERIHRLEQLQIGDTLEAIVEPIGGNLVPTLVLEDFGGKALAIGNLQGAQDTATISHTFSTDPTGYRLRVAVAPSQEASESEYQLVLGLNTVEALTAESEPFGPAILRAPIPVRVMLKIDQITDVDQLAENFGIVASLQLHLHDPAFAFSPDSCRCDVKRFRSDRVINDYLIKNDINVFPTWIFFNQQASRSTQSKILVVEADGTVTLFERFAATLQAPDFNFRQFPFDVQQFYVRVQSLFEEEYFTFVPDVQNSGFGEQLGEEEWIFSQDMFTSEVLTYVDRPQVAFGFTTYRHLNFYIFRIFLPVLIIILISWITFFLREYSRRIEVTSANLLIFIAYNFTIADDLPRIGYLTFTDVVLISTFVVSGLVIIINVWFRRLERAGRGDVAERWDHVLVWLYPLFYVAGGVIVYLIFFPPIAF